MIQGEGGAKAAIRLLPAYINRGEMECKVVIGALETESLQAAFEYLIERLDPKADEFDATERFRLMTWPHGETAMDFFTRYLEEAKTAQITHKQACRFMVTQLPQEVQPKLKELVTPQTADLSEDGAVKFSAEIRQALQSKGIPLDKGWRGVNSPKVCYAKTIEVTSGADHGAVSSEDDEDTVQTVRVRGSEPRFPKSKKATPSERKCFGCGQPGHFIRECPHKRCAVCSQSGHRTSYCPSKRNLSYGKKSVIDRGKVYQVSTSENAVTLIVRIQGKEVAAMFDTGATPCIIDRGTVERLNLTQII